MYYIYKHLFYRVNPYIGFIKITSGFSDNKHSNYMLSYYIILMLDYGIHSNKINSSFLNILNLLWFFVGA